MVYKKSDFLDDNKKWKCIQCGACCRSIKHLLPNFDRGDGVCKNLTEDNKCSIYETRPAICRVEHAFAAGYTDKQMAKACASVANNLEKQHDKTDNEETVHNKRN